MNNKGGFLQGIIIFILALIVLISIGFTFLWIFLDNYERNTPQFYIDRYIGEFTKKSVRGIMNELDVVETEFFTEKEYSLYLDNILGRSRERLTAQMIKKLDDVTTIYKLSNNYDRGIKLRVTKNPEGSTEAYTVKAFDDELELGEMIIISPEQVPVFANGVLIDDKFKLSEKAAVQSFEVAHDKNLVPKLVTYKYSGFFEKPTITVQGEAAVEENDLNVTITAKPTPEEQKAIEAFVIEASKKYATFVSNDTKFSEFSKYLLRETDYYRSIVGFDPSWYIDHDKYAFNNMKVDSYVKHSNTAFSVEVAFDFYVARIPNFERDGKVRKLIEETYPTKYKISMIKRDNRYLIVNLEVI